VCNQITKTILTVIRLKNFAGPPLVAIEGVLTKSHSGRRTLDKAEVIVLRGEKKLMLSSLESFYFKKYVDEGDSGVK